MAHTAHTAHHTGGGEGSHTVAGRLLRCRVVHTVVAHSGAVLCGMVGVPLIAIAGSIVGQWWAFLGSPLKVPFALSCTRTVHMTLRCCVVYTIQYGTAGDNYGQEHDEFVTQDTIRTLLIPLVTL